MRSAGIISLVLGGLTLLWGLIPSKEVSRDILEARAIAQERRFNGLVLGGLLITVGLVVLSFARREGPVQAVAVEQWLTIPVTIEAARIIQIAIRDRGYPPGSGVRITAGTLPELLDVKYDLPSDNADDFVAESNGVTVFVGKALAGSVKDRGIDFVDGVLLVAPVRPAASV